MNQDYGHQYPGEFVQSASNPGGNAVSATDYFVEFGGAPYRSVSYG